MVELSVRTVRYALRAPLRASWGEINERETLRVRLGFPDGLYGEGEAAPLEPFDGVSLASASAAIDAYKEVLSRIEPTADVLAACKAERDLPQALAAIDMALWDHASRRTQTPLAKLIHPLAADEVAVNATIGADDRAGAAEQAAKAVREGFRCVKVKVGIGDDAGRLAAVRAAVGPDVLIRVDANGAWQTPEEALANLRALAPIGLELCEEPVHGVDKLRAVAAESPVRIAMDETHAPDVRRRRARLPEDLARRHLRRARGRAEGPRGGLERLPDVDLRRPARDRGRRPHRGGPADLARVRPRDAGELRRADRSTGAEGRIDRRPFRSGVGLT